VCEKIIYCIYKGLAAANSAVVRVRKGKLISEESGFGREKQLEEALLNARGSTTDNYD
jgi:hypothetical protein